MPDYVSAVHYIGRETELRQLRQAFRVACDTQNPKFVLIQGDFGVGKTALVRQFLAEVSRDTPAVLVGQSVCAIETQLNGLYPFGRIFRDLVEQAAKRGWVADSPAEFTQRTAPAWAGSLAIPSPQLADRAELLARLTESYSDDELRSLCFVLNVDYENLPGQGKASQARELIQYMARRGRIAELLNQCAQDRPGIHWLDFLPAFQEPPASPSMEASVTPMGLGALKREDVFEQFANVVTQLAAKAPVVIFVDDLQWADESSLWLLSHLANFLRSSAVLVMASYQPVEAMETGPQAQVFRQVYTHLPADRTVEIQIQRGLDVAEYVAQRYPRHTFPPDLVPRVQALTEGHALFVSQLFSLWEDTGGLAPSTSQGQPPVWTLTHDLDTVFAIPPTLVKVLEDRIRLIEAGLHDILVCASVEGENFTAQVVSRLRQLEEGQVYDNLEVLDRRYRLIQEHGAQDVGSVVLDFYRFVHRFFREHIYGQLSGGKRRLLHRQVGECLESLTGDRRPIAGQLALHFQAAHDPGKAAPYALMAAQVEHSHYAWSESEKWCELGLQLVSQLPAQPATQQLQSALLEQAGDGYFAYGDYARAGEKYGAALDLARQLDLEAARVAGLHDKLADVYRWQGDTDKAMSLLETGRQILAERQVPFGETHLNIEQAWAGLQSGMGNNDLAARHLLDVLAAAESLPATFEIQASRAGAYNELAFALLKLNRYEESIQASLKAIELARGTSRRREAVGLLDVSFTYFCVGRIQAGLACVERGFQAARQIGDLDEIAYAHASKGLLLWAGGQPDEAIGENKEAIALAEQIGSVWNMVYMHANLALAYLAAGEAELARQHAARSVEYADQNPSLFNLGYAFDALAQAEAALRDWPAAAEHFEKAIQNHRQDGNRHFVGRAQRHLAEALFRQGQHPAAAELAQSALAAFQDLGLAHEIAETHKLLAANAGNG